RWISRLVVQSVRIVGSLSSGSGMCLSNLDGRGEYAPVAATKSVGLDQIREGITAGLTILGENRLQEALPKIEALRGGPIQWHFIGHLQRRKVRLVVGVFDLIQSVDSVELAEEIDRRAREAG